jgi:hypothetical protein
MNKVFTILCLLLPAILGCTSVAQKSAIEKSWEMIGPGGAGSMYFPTVSPHDPNHCFTRCDMTGSYVTRDGGESWHMFHLRWASNDFEFDPVDPEVVYASSTGLYRSGNGGYNWELIFPTPDNVVAERMIGDHSEHFFETRDGLQDFRVDLVRVDPADNNRIIFSTQPKRLGAPEVRVFYSADKGKSFKQLASMESNPARAIYPGSWNGEPDKVYMVTGSKMVAISLTDGKIEELALPVENVRSSHGGYSATDKQSTIYLVTSDVQKDGAGYSGGVYRSHDFGQSWTQTNKGLLGSRPDTTATMAGFMTVSACEGQPEVVYLSCNSWMAEQEDGSLQWRFGTLKSVNGGDDWQWSYLANNDSILTNNYVGYWKDWYYGPGWSEAPKNIGVSPTNPDEVYFSDVRLVRSRDGGANWKQISSDVHPDSSSSIRGISGTTCYGVHFNPFDKEHISVSYADVGLFNSFNGGKSWVHGIEGIPNTMRNTIYAMEFDPEIEGRVYSVWAGCHDLPRPRMFRRGRIETGHYRGAFAISQDGARSWRVVKDAIPETAVCTHVTLDTTSPKDARTLYVCAMKVGVFKSTDSGESWAKMNNGLPELPNTWRTTLMPNGDLYLILVRDHLKAARIDGGLYKSTDGAESWQKVDLPEGYNAPNELTVDPADPNILYLACWPWLEDEHEHCGGVLQSVDGGVSWKQIFREQAHVYMAAVDPEDSNTLILNTFDNAAFRSDDRGESWRQLGGYDFKWGHRVIFDIHDPEMIYLTAFGGNAYHGPAEGTPGVKPTILNLPPLKY